MKTSSGRLIGALAGVLLAGSSFTAWGVEYEEVSDTTVYTTPVETVVSSESEHGSLPGGDHTKWTSDEGEATFEEEYDVVEGSYDDNAETDTPLLDTNTWTEARDGERTDIAVNPGGNTPGTDRFNADVTLEETREATQTVVYVVVPPPPPTGHTEDACKKGGYVALGYANQGLCVSAANH